MDYLSLPQRLLEAFDKYSSPRAVLYRTTTHWAEIGTTQMLQRIAGLSQVLAGLGVKAGDRVAVFAPNCPEWHIADFAISGLGAVVVPIYFHEAPERIVYILQDSGARVAFAAGEEQVKQLLGCRNRAAGLEHLILANGPADLPGDTLRYETVITGANDASVAEYRRRAADVQPEQLATLIYTSGTTGEPKGVMLSHRNISSIATLGVKLDDYHAGDTALSFLPLAHVYERILDYGYLFRGIVVAYVARIEDVAQALLEVRPGFAAVVPRVLEKIYANLMQRGQETGGWRSGVFRWAMKVAAEAGPWRAFGRPAPLRVKLAWQLADRVVYTKIRDGLGGKFRRCVTGGGPLAPELIEFFWSVGIDVYQGYGLTESAAIVSTNTPEANKVGTVGRPVSGVEARIAADGEVEVRGCGIMQGYFNKPAETREALTEDGWLRTGDIGTIDADGYLSITDRKKDLLKTSGGKYVAPQPIENSLKSSPYILNVAVVGDRRKFVAALIVPNLVNVGAQAKQAGIKFSTPAELTAHPWTRALIEKEVERLTKEFARFEQIKRFALLDQDFSVDGGELTYTMKLKRRAIEERFRETIENLYADVAEPRPPALQ